MAFIYHGYFSRVGQQRPLCRHVRPAGFVAALDVAAGDGEVQGADDVSWGAHLGIWRTGSPIWRAGKTYLFVRLPAGILYCIRCGDPGICRADGLVIPSSEAGVDLMDAKTFE